MWIGAEAQCLAYPYPCVCMDYWFCYRRHENRFAAPHLATGNIDYHWLPVILFLLAGLMAFSTGTSWGTFGIMLPIAGDMAAASDIALILPMLSAVLAGSVFGDHCSPISDTTILPSSTGARCNHIDHVSTQLPYACLWRLYRALVSSR